MSRQMSLPVNFKIVQMLKPQTTNAAVQTVTISLKGVNKAWVIFEFTQAVGFASTPTLLQCTDIASATNKAGPSARIWSNLAAATTDTLVARTAGASYALGTATTPAEVVFEIDPSTLDVANGYDCIYFTIGTSSQATDYVSATAILQTSYQQATPPTQVVD